MKKRYELLALPRRMWSFLRWCMEEGARTIDARSRADFLVWFKQEKCMEATVGLVHAIRHERMIDWRRLALEIERKVVVYLRVSAETSRGFEILYCEPIELPENSERWKYGNEADMFSKYLRDNGVPVVNVDAAGYRREKEVPPSKNALHLRLESVREQPMESFIPRSLLARGKEES